jgi:hypothetical protein
MFIHAGGIERALEKTLRGTARRGHHYRRTKTSGRPVVTCSGASMMAVLAECRSFHIGDQELSWNQFVRSYALGGFVMA